MIPQGVGRLLWTSNQNEAHFLDQNAF